MNDRLRYLTGDDALFTGAGSSFKARIKAEIGALWLGRLSKQLNDAASGARHVKFIGSENLRNCLPAILPETDCWITADDRVVAALEGLDHRLIADFCERLYASPAAASFAGSSLLEIAELRWLHLATHEYAKVIALARIDREYRPEKWEAELWSMDGPRHIRYFKAGALGPFEQLMARLGEKRITRGQLRMYNALSAAYGFGAERPAVKQPGSLDAGSVARKDTLLAIAYYDRTIIRLLQAVPHLRGDLGIPIHVVCALRDVRLETELRMAGCEVSHITDWLDIKQWQESQREVSAVGKKSWQWLCQHGDRLLGDLAVMGIPLLDIVRPYLKAAFCAALPDAAGAAMAANAIDDALRPGCVLNFEDFELNRAITLVANRRNAATLAYYTLSPTWRSDGMIRRSQHHVAVAGQQLAEVFAPQYGKHLRIVGDTLKSPLGNAAQRQVFRDKQRALLNLAEDQKLVLLLASYPKLGRSTDTLRQVFKRTSHAVHQLGNVRLVVKPHPRQDLRQLQRWMTEWGVEGDIVKDAVLHELCCAADLVSTTVSSSVVQALLAHVPVICLVQTKVLELYETRGNHYIAGGGIRCIGETEDEVAIARDLLFSPLARASQIKKGIAHAEYYIGPLNADPVKLLGSYIEALMPQPETASAAMLKP